MPLFTEIATYDMTEMTFPAVLVMPDGWKEYIVVIQAKASADKKLNINNALNETGYGGSVSFEITIGTHAWLTGMIFKYMKITEDIWIAEKSETTVVSYANETMTGKTFGTNKKYIIITDNTTDATITEGTLKVYMR